MPAESTAKLHLSLENLENALRRLAEALAEPPTNALAVDGTIQRFEFVIELFWKTYRRALLVEGVETKTPRESLSQAYQAQWLDDESTWLAMLKDRNETSHLYDEERARQIYEHIREYCPVLQRALEILRNRYPRNKAR